MKIIHKNQQVGSMSAYLNRIEKKFGNIETMYAEIIAPSESVFQDLFNVKRWDLAEKIQASTKLTEAQKQKLFREYQREMLSEQKKNLDQIQMIWTALQSKDMPEKDKPLGYQHFTKAIQSMLAMAQKVVKILERKKEPQLLISAVKKHITGLEKLSKNVEKVKSKKTTVKKVTAKKVTAKKVTAKKVTAKKVTAKKVTAKKVTAKKVTAKKVTAKKTNKSRNKIVLG